MKKPYPKLLLMSNSTNYGEEYLAYPEVAVKSFLGSERITLAFIPFAGVSITWGDYTNRVRERFGAWGYEVASVHDTEDPRQLLAHAGAIMIGGGNSFQLLNELYRFNVIDTIRQEVNAGKPYIGWSAGSNVACPTIMTTNDMPIISPPSLKALNLVQFQINPHFNDLKPVGHNGETRAERLQEYIAVNKDVTVVGLYEGTILRIENGEIEIIGEKPVKIFRHGRDIEEITSGKLLNNILLPS